MLPGGIDMQIIIKALILVFFGTLMVSCSSGPYPVTSPYFFIPVGTKLIVHKKITIPANKARVYIQGGKLIPGQPDQYHGHCWFLSWKVLEREQTIEPGVFTVTGSQKYDDYVNKKSEFQLAAKRSFTDLQLFDTRTAVKRVTTLKIHSDKQKDIREFSCGYWDSYFDGDHLTVAEIQQVVGGLVEIKLKK